MTDLMMNFFDVIVLIYYILIMARNSKSVMPYKNDSGFGRDYDLERDSGFDQGFG